MRREKLVDRLKGPALVGDWPTWTDLEAGQVVFEPQTVEEVRQKLTNLRLCVLAGPEGRGKTSLARYVGYTGVGAGRTVFYLDISEPGGEALNQICLSIQELDQSRPLYIIENVHEADDYTFLAQLFRTALKTTQSQFLYTERVATKESIFDALEFAIGGHQITRAEIEIRLAPDIHIVQKIVEVHVNSSGKSGLVLPSETDLRTILKTCGGNLRILSAFIEAWERGQLTAVAKEDVLKIVYRRRLAPIDAHLRPVLARISGIARFGVPVLGEVFGRAEAEELAGQRILGRAYVGLEEYFTLPHSSDGAINVAAWAQHIGTTEDAVTNDSLRRYFTFKPNPTNTGHLLTKLRATDTTLQNLLREDAVLEAFVQQFEEAMDEAPLTYFERSFRIANVSSKLRDRLAKAVLRRGPALLAAKIKSSDEALAAWALRVFSQLDKTFGRKVADSIQPSDWEEIWLKLPLPKLIRFLYRYAKAPDVHWHTETARKVLGRLAEADDFGERIQRLSYELTGKLLYVSRQLGASAASLIGERIADSVDLNACREPERLTLILKELWQADQKTAYLTLLNRTLEQVPMDLFTQEKSGRGLAFLLLSISLSREDGVLEESRARTLLQSVLIPEVAAVIERWESPALRTFLWSGMLIDQGATAAWVKKIAKNGLSRACTATKSPIDRFFVLWNLVLLDTDTGGLVTEACWKKFVETASDCKRQASPEDLPFIGLCSWVIPIKTIDYSLPGLDSACIELTKKADASSLVFAANAYRAAGSRRAAEFVVKVLSALNARGISSPHEYLTTHPNELARRVLNEILEDCSVSQTATSG